MSDLLASFERNIRTRELLQDGQGIVVAVSGGMDSMVLLDLLYKSAPEHGWRLTVAHLNHQLRGRSSDADERLVRRTTENLRLPIVVERAKVREFAGAEGISIEMAARKLRHDFLARVARRLKHCPVGLAHHADDQLELFFLRLLRGSGGEGLAGMQWRNPSPVYPKIELVRPLLDQPKAALREYAAEHKIRFREDTTNALLDFQRNRIRHELLPLLRKKYQPALAKTVLRVMEITGNEAEFVTEVAREWLQGRNQRAEGKIAGFGELPVALQRRCLQLQLLSHGIAGDFDLIEQLRLKPGRAVAVGKQRGNTPGALYLLRDAAGILHLHTVNRMKFRDGSQELDLSQNGEVIFDRAKVQWQTKRAKFIERLKATAGCEVFDADKVGRRVMLRHWRPGDRFQPIGMDASVKLQDIFTNQRVPRGRRRELILAETAHKEIFWVEGLRIAERFKLTKSTIRRLQWRWERF